MALSEEMTDRFVSFFGLHPEAFDREPEALARMVAMLAAADVADAVGPTQPADSGAMPAVTPDA